MTWEMTYTEFQRKDKNMLEGMNYIVQIRERRALDFQGPGTYVVTKAFKSVMIDIGMDLNTYRASLSMQIVKSLLSTSWWTDNKAL